MASGDSAENYAVFRECISSIIVARSSQHKPNKAPKRRSYKAKSARRKDNAESRDVSSDSISSAAEEENPEELADFIDVLSPLIYTCPSAGSVTVYQQLNQNSSLLPRSSAPFQIPFKLSHTPRSNTPRPSRKRTPYH
jgi:hypothetical protein